MIRFLLTFLWLLSTIGSAQTTISDEPFWLHKSKPDAEEDIDSRFLIIKSNKPEVERSINTMLQMETFGMLLTERRKVDLLKAQDENPFARTNLSYSITKVSARFLYVDILTYRFRNSMSLNGDYVTKRYYFDAQTGQRVHFRDFFTDAGYAQLTKRGIESFRGSFVNIMKRYQGDDFSLEKVQELNEECGCNCLEHINKAFCSTDLLFDSPAGSIVFTMPDCDWMNPRQRETYRTELTLTEAKAWLSDYGKYIVLGGTPVVNPSPYHKLWKGTLDGKIATTFYFWPDCNGTTIRGLEVYDSFGASIPMGGSAKGQTLSFGELDGNGKAVATFDVTLQNGKLTGTWKKADGSKTMTFEAVPANP
jgi:hypothetical protein